MQASEVRALDPLGGRLASEATGLAEDLQGVVAPRPFRSLGPVGAKDRRLAEALVGWLS